jgi:hypothetical protein
MSKTFTINKDKLKELTYSLSDPIPKLKPEELIRGSEYIDDIECLICKSIAISPLSCSACDTIFCYACLSQYRTTQPAS